MNRIDFTPGCQTTAMAIMPHADIEPALDLALSLDIPYWPQLPKVGFHEDMYVQAAENLPGVTIDYAAQKISFNTAAFQEGLEEYSRRMADPDYFALDPAASLVYYRFLSRDLRGYTAIRGQVSGPVNLGFRIMDESSRPIIYDDAVRPILFDFIQRKVNVQYRQLREKNPHAFVWVDEPGLMWVFSGLSGYNDVQAKQDYQSFLAGLEGPTALHLCSNINLPYLLELGVELLSFDAYQLEVMPRGYAASVATFIKNGGVISWGIVPTDPAQLSQETPEALARRLLGYWEVIASNTGIAVRQIAERALIAPAKCCVKSQGSSPGSAVLGCEIRAGAAEEQSVVTAFDHLRRLSRILKDKFGL